MRLEAAHERNHLEGELRRLARYGSRDFPVRDPREACGPSAPTARRSVSAERDQRSHARPAEPHRAAGLRRVTRRGARNRGARPSSTRRRRLRRSTSRKAQ